jgi:hypothetical protein
MMPGALKIRRSLILAIFFLLFTSGSAMAMTVVAADLPDMVRDSQAIVHAVVTQVENVVLWENNKEVPAETLRALTNDNRPTGMRAFTDVTLHVFETYKGSPESGQTMKLRLVGGKMGPFTLRVPGMPNFEEKTEVILFLHETVLGFTPVGAGQGVFRIQRNNSKNAIAVHDMKGMAVLRHQALPTECGENTLNDGTCAPSMGSGFPAIPDTMPLESLDAQVRALLGLPPTKGLRTAPATFPSQR